MIVHNLLHEALAVVNNQAIETLKQILVDHNIDIHEGLDLEASIHHLATSNNGEDNEVAAWLESTRNGFILDLFDEMGCSDMYYLNRVFFCEEDLFPDIIGCQISEESCIVKSDYYGIATLIDVCDLVATIFEKCEYDPQRKLLKRK